MRPFKQLGNSFFGFSQNGAGFNTEARDMRPSLGGETEQHYSAPIQQTPVRERVNSALKLNLLNFGGL